MTATLEKLANRDGRSLMTLADGAAQEITLRVGPLVNLPQLVVSLGQDPQPIFHNCGFQVQRFQDPENRVPFIPTSNLITRCVELTGADQLGLLLGQIATPSHLGLSGFLAQSASSVEEALGAVVANLDLHDQGGFASLDIGPSHSSFSYTLQQSDISAAEQVSDLAAVMIYQIMRGLCGEDWVADSVGLERREPAEPLPYKKFFDTQIYFNATHSTVTFKNSWLKATPSGSDPLLYSHLAAEAELLHETYKGELMDELPSCLHKALLCGQFSSKQVAAGLGIHERTLHRRLKAEETSFRSELDRARRGLSEQLLCSTSLPVCDIASTLGYSDSSGFIRAFQRWCGTSPSAWRRQHQTAPGSGKKAS